MVVLDETNVISLGELTMRLMKSQEGRPYILLSQPWGGKSDRCCCWFPEDWDAIQRAIPQIQILMVSSKEEKVHVDVNKHRTVSFTIGKNSVAVCIESNKKNMRSRYCAWIPFCDWNCLVCKQTTVNNYLHTKDEDTQRTSKDGEPQSTRKPKRKRRDRQATKQIPIRGRNISIPCYRYTLYNVDLAGNDLPVKLKVGGPYLTQTECIVAGEKAKSIFGQEAGTLDIDSTKYQLTNDIMAVKMVYLWLLCRKLNEFKNDRDCTACSEDQPGQEANLDGSLEDWGDFVALNVDDADEEITTYDVSDLYIEVLKYLNCSVPSTVCAIAQCLKAYSTDQHDDLAFYSENGIWHSDILNTVFSNCLQTLEDKQPIGS